MINDLVGCLFRVSRDKKHGHRDYPNHHHRNNAKQDRPPAMTQHGSSLSQLGPVAKRRVSVTRNKNRDLKPLSAVTTMKRMAVTRHCWKCGQEYKLSGSPGRSEACLCGADLKVCVNCVSYDPRV